MSRILQSASKWKPNRCKEAKWLRSASLLQASPMTSIISSKVSASLSNLFLTSLDLDASRQFLSELGADKSWFSGLQ
ncbi:hypothetical protein AL055_04460 [Pseudomonas amygdali pv. morsprunorum]|nr:hypothetical protein AL055_04460 [Pseudomonas amygdali pv. morsprunorum]